MTGRVPRIISSISRSTTLEMAVAFSRSFLMTAEPSFTRRIGVAIVAGPADDHMIDQDQPDNGSGSIQVPGGHVIFWRGVRLARGMVVSKHDRRGGGAQRGFDHPPDVHRGLRGGAFADHLLFKQMILPIEKESYGDLVSSPGEPRLEVGRNC